ncbi:MAG: hypothetical protein HY820_17575 [Acidobacteria bacterium]|nr:hypothetical protein [Acidobacteriota bacterium]
MSPDPASLRLLDNSPVSCVLLEPEQASAAMLSALRARGVKSIAVAHTRQEADAALPRKPDAVALEGAFSTADEAAIGSRLPVVRITPRAGLRVMRDVDVLATNQGVWPSVRQEHSGPKTSSAPTGNVWIDTNTGVLRYLKSATNGAVWQANFPPRGERLPASHYAHAIADAASVGARWVVALDSAFAKELLGGDARASADWRTIQVYLRFYETHAEWRGWPAYAELTMIQDASSGALISGNLLDMLSVMNTPVRAVPSRELSSATLRGSKLTVTIHPQEYTEEQRALIASFAANGGKVVKGDAGFRMPPMRDGRITFDKEDYRKLEAIWPELHLAIMRKNFGVRMFNVAGTLSYLQRSPDGRRTVLQLVNFTDYPVEAVTAFVQGKYKTARLLSPDGPSEVTIYDAPEGTGVEIERLGLFGAVVLE